MTYEHKFPVYNPLVLWWEWVGKLLNMSSEPQELEILGSLSAANCIQFVYKPRHHIEQYTNVLQYKKDYQANRGCNKIEHVKMVSTEDHQPKRLETGTFLICGDRAWAGIPSHLLRGQCTFGRLSLFTLNQTPIMDWQQKNNLRIQKQSIDNLDEHCESEIIHLSKLKRAAVSLFLPWVAAAKALGELGHLECWVVKQANLTTTAISDLLADEEIARKATLQNRAAIDFLLLLHGHECQEFKGLCCLNLTSKAPDVHTSLQKMQELITDIKKKNQKTGWGTSSQGGGWLGGSLPLLNPLFGLFCFPYTNFLCYLNKMLPFHCCTPHLFPSWN